MTIEYTEWRKLVDMRVYERLQIIVDDYPEEEYLQNHQTNYAPSEMAELIINFKNSNN